MTALVGDRWELAPYENSETDDLNLMAACDGHIMANSSFSWWASYLNPFKDKVVTCPNDWFSDEIIRCDPQHGWIMI